MAVGGLLSVLGAWRNRGPSEARLASPSAHAPLPEVTEKEEALVRITGPLSLIAVVLLTATTTTPLLGEEVRWAGWGQDETVGAGLEGTHAWVSHGLYARGVEVGLTKAQAAAGAIAVMSIWELIEIEFMDSEGISTQDMVANTAGVLAGAVGAGVNHSYATWVTPTSRTDKLWLNVPLAPQNATTYSVEVDYRGFVAGYKYLGREGDIVVGSTAMPVHPGEAGSDDLIWYAGRIWESGWHCAVGYGDAHGVVGGGGRRLSVFGFGVDATALLDADGARLGLSCFIPYGSVF